MSQNEPGKTSPDKAPVTPDTELPSQVTEDIGGVQGEAPDEDDASASPEAEPGLPSDAPAPDAGEIEWAGQVVKKPPTPAN